jgi:hypothetical protein
MLSCVGREIKGEQSNVVMFNVVRETGYELGCLTESAEIMVMR